MEVGGFNGGCTVNIQKHLHVIKLLVTQIMGPFTPSLRLNAEMTLAIMFSLKTIELLENGLQPHSGVIPLFSMRSELLESSQS